MRYSGSKVRWDKNWLLEELTTLNRLSGVVKVFVCGPPIMNQTFDMAFEEIASKLNLNWKDIELF